MHSAPPSMLAKNRRPLHGFTLVELLVVIAIIGILVAMLLPAVQAAREAARRLQCANHFKQVGLALHNYHDARSTFPTGQFLWLPGDGMNDSNCGVHDSNTPGGIYFGWATFILPFLEQQEIYDQADFGAWSAGDLITNYAFMGLLIDTYVCPSNPQGGEFGFTGVGPPPSGFNGNDKDDARLTSMAGVSDSDEWLCVGAWPKALSVSDGMLAEQEGCRIADVRDGTSKTLMVAEVTGGGPGSQRGHYWIANDLIDTRDGINGPFSVPGDMTIAGQGFSYRDTGPSSYHPGGCQFLLADGSVHFLSESISLTALIALTTRDGGDSVPAGSF